MAQVPRLGRRYPGVASSRAAPLLLAILVPLLAPASSVQGQDTTRLPTTIRPDLTRALDRGTGPPQVLRVDPDVLNRMTRQPTTAQAVDTARFITSRVGTEALRSAAEESLDGDRRSYVLPYRVLATSASAGEAGSRSYLRPIIQVAGDGLSFAGSEEGFRGTVYVGVQDSLQPQAREPLPDSIHFLMDAEGGRVEPGRVAVSHTNLPFAEVTVLSRENRDSVRLRIRSSVWADPVPLTLPVSRPALWVTATPRAVPGLGLQTADIQIRTDRIAAGSVPITVESTLGRPEPSEVRLGPGGTATVRLRSTGLGTADVTAHSPGYRSASTRVQFLFPLSFILAALLGGIAGGTAHWFRERGEEEGDSWIRESGAGLIFGVIVAVAYAVGVNLLGVELQAQYGEALVFTLAALGGYFRIPVRERARGAPA